MFTRAQRQIRDVLFHFIWTGKWVKISGIESYFSLVTSPYLFQLVSVWHKEEIPASSLFIRLSFGWIKISCALYVVGKAWMTLFNRDGVWNKKTCIGFMWQSPDSRCYRDPDSIGFHHLRCIDTSETILLFESIHNIQLLYYWKLNQSLDVSLSAKIYLKAAEFVCLFEHAYLRNYWFELKIYFCVG